MIPTRTAAPRGRRMAAAIAFLLAVSLTACIEDEVAAPPVVPEGGSLFERYVSLGNSITAGYQSGGINVVLQGEAYPVLLAAKAGATFGIPALGMPGCPPPLAAPLSADRIGNIACALRLSRQPALVQNLAVPGATVSDIADLEGPGFNFLTTLILGGRTQLEAMMDARPSLVSLWIGNNDALAAALTGDTARLTPLDVFADALGRIVEGIAATPAEDAILIGVARPALVAPAIQPGAYFWVAARSDLAPVPLDVDDDCAPGTPGGANLVSFLVADGYLSGRATSVTISCADDAPYVLNAVEQAAVQARVEAFNTAIEGAANAHGWIYIDPTAAFTLPALADPDLVRKCQGLPAATDSAAIAAAVRNTCPSVDAPGFFGTYFSFDGIHPSGAAHRVLADTLAVRLNDRHGLTLPVGSP